MNTKSKILSILAISITLLSIGSYAVFATKPDTDAKKQRLEKLRTEYREKQRKIEAEIKSMPRNSEEDWNKIKDAEHKLKEMPMAPEADLLIRELESQGTEKAKKDLETRIFYSKDSLMTESKYSHLAKTEKDTVKKQKYEKAAKIMQRKMSLLEQVENDFKAGKGTYEDLNRRIDELMAIDPFN